MEDFAFHEGDETKSLVFAAASSSSSVFNVTLAGNIESDQIPVWTAWMSSAFLVISAVFGLPLNGATVVIFWRRKKLRHLVNFVLLLDCLSHIVLCLVCIPIHVSQSIWKPQTGPRMPLSSLALTNLQQVVTTFSNLCGILLTLAIAILRYRRLCWKKKDKFSPTNALKWTLMSGLMAIGFPLTESWTRIQSQSQSGSLLVDQPLTALTFYTIKLTLILLSMLAVFFCYIRVAQRVWSSGANQQEKVMDATKLKKSRSVHMRATFHSVVQIVLVTLTLTPYLYQETMETFKSPSSSSSQDNGFGSSYNQTDRLLTTTINYVLLILGTPLAYIASCHRFREQFTSILWDIFGHSPDPYAQNNPELTQQSGGGGGGGGGQSPACRADSTKSHQHRGSHPQDEEKHRRRHSYSHVNNNCRSHFNFNGRQQSHLCLTHSSSVSNSTSNSSSSNPMTPNNNITLTVTNEKNRRFIHSKGNNKHNNRTSNNDNKVQSKSNPKMKRGIQVVSKDDPVTMLILSQRERDHIQNSKNARKSGMLLGDLIHSSFDRQDSILDSLRPVSSVPNNVLSNSSSSVSSSSASPSPSTCTSNSNSNSHGSVCGNNSQQQQHHHHHHSSSCCSSNSSSSSSTGNPRSISKGLAARSSASSISSQNTSTTLGTLSDVSSLGGSSHLAPSNSSNNNNNSNNAKPIHTVCIPRLEAVGRGEESDHNTASSSSSAVITTVPVALDFGQIV